MLDDAMIDSSIDAPPPCAAPNAFGAEVSFPVGDTGVGLAVGRLDLGATLDVAVAVTTEVVILHGDGTGNVFGTPSKVDTPAIGVAIDDFDIVDVRKDLALWGGNSAVIRRQDPANAGTFLAAQPLPGSFQNVTNVLVEEFGSTLLADLIVQDDIERRVYEQLQGTPGTFSSEDATGVAGDNLVAALQVDGAADSDALFVDGSGNVKLAVTNGTGMQGTTMIATGATGRAAAFGNFDGDLIPDLVIATTAGGIIFTQNAAARGTFTQVPGPAIPGIVGDRILIADINMDGTDDIVVPGSVVMQCPSPAAPGIFTQVESVSSVAPSVLIDVNGNGKPDLLRLVGTDLVVRLQ